MSGFRAHELIAQLDQNSEIYNDCMASLKFDLGSVETANELSALSKGEFFDIPAPICLFQVVNEDSDPYFLLARKSSEHQLLNPKTEEIYPNTVVWDLFLKLNSQWLAATTEVIVAANTPNGCCCFFDKGKGKFIENINDLGRNELWEVHLILGIAKAIEVFSCSNVITIEQSAPRFLNEKRHKKGKVPFFSYRTLHITGERTEYQHDKDSKGTHASPRLHLRRGHIRKLADGRRVWVSACLVGDKSKGHAIHDYHVDQLEKIE